MFFGETDEQTGKKVTAAFAADLQPVLCVGETLAQREAGDTMAVVTRQLEAALGARDGKARVTIAYERSGRSAPAATRRPKMPRSSPGHREWLKTARSRRAVRDSLWWKRQPEERRRASGGARAGWCAGRAAVARTPEAGRNLCAPP